MKYFVELQTSYIFLFFFSLPDRRGGADAHRPGHPQRAELAGCRRAAVGRPRLPPERHLHPGRRPHRGKCCADTATGSLSKVSVTHQRAACSVCSAADGGPGQELRGPAAAQLPGGVQPRHPRGRVVLRQAVRHGHGRQPGVRGAVRLLLPRRPGRREGGPRVLPLGALGARLLRRRLPHGQGLAGCGVRAVVLPLSFR